MFEDFPKQRTILSESYLSIYAEHYENNRVGKTVVSALSQFMESWMHRQVAKDIRTKSTRDCNMITTLEVGAGTLNQLKYERPTVYDIIEPFQDLYRMSPFMNKIRYVYSDISEIPFGFLYDRITAIASFEHILNLLFVVAKTCLLLKPGGCLRVAIPNEGCFLWYLGWKLTTGIEFYLKYKLDYSVIMKHEHVNLADEIDTVLRYFYGVVRCRVFGLHPKIAFYRFYECKCPNVEYASSYLKK